MRHVVSIAAVLWSCTATAQAPASAEALYLRGAAATCATCHGTDGRSAATDAGLQRLAGLDKAYLVEQLTAFREGRRPATVMQQLAKGYTPAQIEQIAAYFAAQK